MKTRSSVGGAMGCTLALVMLPAGWAMVGPATALAQSDSYFSAKFLSFADLACKELNKQITPFEEKHRTVADHRTHHVPFFEDSYGVRALCAAYDMTGRQEYFEWDCPLPYAG